MLVGTAGAWGKALPYLRSHACSGVKCDDQHKWHQLYLDRNAHGLRMATDNDGMFAVNMRKCSGPQFKFPNTCFPREFDPVARAYVNMTSSQLMYASEAGGNWTPLAMHVPGGPRTHLHAQMRQVNSLFGAGLPKEVLVHAQHEKDAKLHGVKSLHVTELSGGVAAEVALGRRLSPAGLRRLRGTSVALLASGGGHSACNLSSLTELAPALVQ